MLSFLCPVLDRLDLKFRCTLRGVTFSLFPCPSDVVLFLFQVTKDVRRMHKVLSVYPVPFYHDRPGPLWGLDQHRPGRHGHHNRGPHGHHTPRMQCRIGPSAASGHDVTITADYLKPADAVFYAAAVGTPRSQPQYNRGYGAGLDTTDCGRVPHQRAHQPKLGHQLHLPAWGTPWS